MLDKKWWTLIGVGITSTVVAVDFTIVNTVLPNIQQDFAANLNTLQWVMTAFGISFSALLVSMGRLGDLFGRRLLLYIGMIGFGITSLFAGLAGSLLQLILCRLGQGIFAAIVYPCGMAITAKAFSKTGQGKALGIYGSFLGIGLAAGPVLGGVITTIANWRWIFFINIPCILISFIICLFTVQESKVNKKIIIDWFGILLISTSLAGLVFVITQTEVYGFFSPYILLTLLGALILLSLFVISEKRSASPLLPPKLFLNHLFFIGSTVYSVCIGLIWPVIFFVPLYLQNVLHRSELETGILLLPMTLMTVIAPPIAGWLFDKKGPFLTTMIAFAASLMGMILLLFFSTQFSGFLFVATFILLGLSWGIGNGIALPIALGHPDNKENEGLISGAAITALNIFAVLMLSVASGLFHFMNNKFLADTSAALAFVYSLRSVTLLLIATTLLAFFAILLAFRQTKDA